MVLEKTLESPLDCKEVQPVHSKGDQSWVFFGWNDAKAETPVLRPPHAKSWLIEKDSGAGKDWGQEEKEMTEDEMAEWHHWLDGHEFEWTLGVGDGQGGLACCNSWGCKELDMTEWLDWTALNWWCLLHFPVDSNFQESGQQRTWWKENRAPLLLGRLTPVSHKAASQSNPTPKRCPGVSGAGTGEQKRKPEIYTSGVKWLHEHTALVSPTNTEMKLTVILRVDQNTDQKSRYCNY